jgi:excisionase family DNA binding protein
MSKQTAIATEFYKAREVAAILGINQSEIYRVLAEGGVPAIRAGGTWRIAKRTIDEMIARSETTAIPSVDEAKQFGEVRAFAEACEIPHPDRAARVLSMRFMSHLTLEQTARHVNKEFGANVHMSRERIRQIEKGYLDHIRRAIFSGKIVATDLPDNIPGLHRILLEEAIERLQEKRRECDRLRKAVVS